MTQIFGSDILGPIPPNHEIWTDEKYGAPIKASLRIKNPDGSFSTQKNLTPKLDGITFDGRLVVVFSQYDLSCAMENKSVSDCSGYTRKDATLIARKIVLYSLLSDSKPKQ